MQDAGESSTEQAVRRVMATVPRSVGVVVVWSGCFVVVVVGLYVAGKVAVRLAPLALALAATVFLAALLQPLTTGLRKVRCPAALAALVAVLFLLAVVIVPVFLAWQRGSGQLTELTGQLGEGLRRVRDLLTAPGSPIEQRQLDQLTGEAATRLRQLLPSPVAGARAAVEVIAVTLLVMVLLFFVLKDGPGMWGWLVGKADGPRRRTVAAAGEAAWSTLTSYARGTVVIALMDAAGIGLALVLLNVPMALALALITFLGAFVPIIGATVAGSLAVLVALAAQGPGTALLVAGAVIVVQQVEGNLLQPMIMKRQISLHPVVILVAITAGTLVGGIAGAFVAVPMTAVTYQVFAVVHARRTERHRETTGAAQPCDAEPAPRTPAQQRQGHGDAGGEAG